MVFKMLPEGFDGPIQSSCLHAIRRHSALGASSYAIPGRSPKRKTEPGRTPVPFDLEASTGSTGSDAERVEFNSSFRRGPRYEQHFLVAVLVTGAVLGDDVRNLRQRSGQHRRVEELRPRCPV